MPPTIHASYAPTFGIKPRDPVTFKVGTFRTKEGEEAWDFGDGSPPATVKSGSNNLSMANGGYASIVHRYARPGHYLIRVERTSQDGFKAIAHLQVRVGMDE